MRRTLVMIAAILFLAGSTSLSTELLESEEHISAPPSGGQSVTIDSNESWNGPATLDGQVLVADGAQLEINGDIMVSEGSSITVEGVLKLNANSTIKSQVKENSLSVKYQDGTINVPLSESGNNSIVLHFDSNVSGFGPTFHNGQGANFIAAGTSESIYYNNDSDVNEALIDISHQPYGITTITSIIVTGPSGEEQPYFPAELESTGLYYCCNYQWSIVVGQGQLVAEEAEISGAQITVGGNMNISNSVIDRSGPIVVADDGELHTTDSTFTRSFDDEDIRANLAATVIWDSSTGTGGFVDHWTKVMGVQTIQTPVAEVNLLATGLGWQGLSKSGASDENGAWELEIPERIVALENSSGGQWTENAEIQYNWVGPWGNFSSTVTLANDNSSMIVDIPLPNLKVDSLEVSSSGDAELSIHSPLEIIATVSNSGVAAENVSLDCTLNNGSDARISPAYPILNVPTSGTQTVSFTWRGTSEGTKSLNCVIVKPNDWLNSGVWDDEGANSDDVTWLALVDADEGSGIVIILLAAMAVGIVLAITIAMRQQQEELGVETTEEDDVKDYDDIDSEIEDLEEVD